MKPEICPTSPCVESIQIACSKSEAAQLQFSKNRLLGVLLDPRSRASCVGRFWDIQPMFLFEGTSVPACGNQTKGGRRCSLSMRLSDCVNDLKTKGDELTCIFPLFSCSIVLLHRPRVTPLLVSAHRFSDFMSIVYECDAWRRASFMYLNASHLWCKCGNSEELYRSHSSIQGNEEGKHKHTLKDAHRERHLSRLSAAWPPSSPANGGQHTK